MNHNQPISTKRKLTLVFLLLAILISGSIYWIGNQNAQQSLRAYSQTLPFIDKRLIVENKGGLGKAQITLLDPITLNEISMSGFYHHLTFPGNAFSKISIEGLRLNSRSSDLINKAISGELPPLASIQHYAKAIEIKNCIVKLNQQPLEIIYNSSDNQAELIAQNRLTHIYIKQKAIKDEQQFNLNLEFINFSNILVETMISYNWPASYKIISWEHLYIDAFLQGHKNRTQRNWAYLGLFKDIKLRLGKHIFQIDELSFGLNGLDGKNYSLYLIAHSCKWESPQYQSSLFNWEYHLDLYKGKKTGLFNLSPISLRSKEDNYNLYFENLHLQEKISASGSRYLCTSSPVNLSISESAKGSASLLIDEKGLHIKEFYQREGILSPLFKARMGL